MISKSTEINSNDTPISLKLDTRLIVKACKLSYRFLFDRNDVPTHRPARASACTFLCVCCVYCLCVCVVARARAWRDGGGVCEGVGGSSAIFVILGNNNKRTNSFRATMGSTRRLSAFASNTADNRVKNVISRRPATPNAEFGHHKLQYQLS